MKLTPIVIMIFVVGLIGFDAYVILTESKLESVSSYLIRWSYEYPMIPFLIGFLMGHLFWRMRSKDVWFKGKLK